MAIPVLCDLEEYQGYHQDILNHIASEQSKIGVFLRPVSGEFNGQEIVDSIKIIKDHIDQSKGVANLNIKPVIEDKSKIIVKKLVEALNKTILSRVDDFKNMMTAILEKEPGSGIKTYQQVQKIENFNDFLEFVKDLEQSKLIALRSALTDIEFFNEIEPVCLSPIFISLKKDLIPMIMKKIEQLVRNESENSIESIDKSLSEKISEVSDIVGVEKLFEILSSVGLDRDQFNEALEPFELEPNIFWKFFDLVESLLKEVANIKCPEIDQKIKDAKLSHVHMMKKCMKEICDKRMIQIKHDEDMKIQEEALKKDMEEKVEAELIKANKEKEDIKKEYENDIKLQEEKLREFEEQQNLKMAEQQRMFEEEQKKRMEEQEKMFQELNQKREEEEREKESREMKYLIIGALSTSKTHQYYEKDYYIITGYDISTSQMNINKKTCILAFNSITINSNINIGGTSNLVMVAPIIEVKGTYSINLGGLDGEEQIPLSAAGKSGENGGNFYCIAGKLNGFENLTVDVHGGKGSNGSRGLDGSNGYEERSMFPSIEYKHHGKDGGHGGVGSYGGKTGEVVITNNKGEIVNDIKIKILFGNGKPGLGGKGGKGGKRGYDANRVTDYYHWGLNGTDGKDNTAGQSVRLGESPKLALNVIHEVYLGIEKPVKEYFDQYNRGEISKVGEVSEYLKNFISANDSQKGGEKQK